MKRLISSLLPIVLLGGLLLVFFKWGPVGIFLVAFPPVEELTIQRIQLPESNIMVVDVINGGPHLVTIAQVTVDDALWQFWTEPEQLTITRLGQMRIYIPYPWVEGEPHEVSLITSTGLTFSKEIPVATRSPKINISYLWTFSLLGIYAGVIPVFLGILWYPFLRDLGSHWISFFLSLTIGLLAFLAVDTLEEGFKTAQMVPSAYQGVALIGIGIISPILCLAYLSRRKTNPADKTNVESRYWVALMIALGIGLHNLGEGLAIGASYATGEIALGSFLVVGFTLHNLTEGLGIITPIAQDRPRISRLIWLGLIAGGPTLLGTWIGGFSYSPIWATLFLSVGTGAILQVIYELVGLLSRRENFGLVSGYNLSGFLVGLGIMYLTGLLVVA